MPCIRHPVRCQAPVTERRREGFWSSVQIPRPLPRHVAICMDGNRRWAMRHRVPIQTAYYRAESAAESVIDSCQILGVEALTLFAFSSENWRRDFDEVKFLMALFQDKLERSWRQWRDRGIQIKFIGDLTKLSGKMQRLIGEVEPEMQSNDGLQLTIALSYGGRQDLLRSIQKLAGSVLNGDVQPTEITESDLEQCLQSQMAFGDVGDPDLFIRTSGERRLSNFMLWDLAYTELYFEDVLWPDFGQQQLLDALDDYSQRDRRYGR